MLVQGDRLTLSRRQADYSMTLDGREHSPTRAIIASKLGLGFHLIELTRDDPESKTKEHLQLPLSIVSPVQLTVRPVTKLKLDGNSNGGLINLQLHNRSRSEHAVRVEPASLPDGWMALRLGKPIRILKPGESVTVEIQVERMVVADVPREPLPFSVWASLPGTDITAVATTFYVEAQEAFPRGRRPKRPALTVF